MAAVTCVTALWSGFDGAPGYSKFHFAGELDQAGCQAAGNLVQGFFGQLAPVFKSDWSVLVQNVVQTFDYTNGDLIGEKAIGGMTDVVGALPPTTAYAGGSGFVIRWSTGSIFHGRKVAGRTFIVPAAGVYEPDGSITSGTISMAQAAAAILIGSPDVQFCVWGRQWDKTQTPPKQIGGMTAEVIAGVIPDRAAQLRSRRSS